MFLHDIFFTPSRYASWHLSSRHIKDRTVLLNASKCVPKVLCWIKVFYCIKRSQILLYWPRLQTVLNTWSLLGFLCQAHVSLVWFFSICDYTLQALAYVFRSQVSCSQSEDIGLSMSGLEKGHFRQWMKWDIAEIGFLKLWIMQSFCIGASE